MFRLLGMAVLLVLACGGDELDITTEPQAPLTQAPSPDAGSSDAGSETAR